MGGHPPGFEGFTEAPRDAFLHVGRERDESSGNGHSRVPAGRFGPGVPWSCSMTVPQDRRQAGSVATGSQAAKPAGSADQPLSARDRFDRLANRVTAAVGSPIAVALAVLVVLVWLVSGPVFNFSDTWQLVINTSTTIVTFWMVFLIQASANRDNRALHLKLDEVIRAMGRARNEFITTEEATEAEFAVRETELRAIAEDDANGRNGANGHQGQGRARRTDETHRSTRQSTTRTRTDRAPAASERQRSGKPSTDGGE